MKFAGYSSYTTLVIKNGLSRLEALYKLRCTLLYEHFAKPIDLPAHPTFLKLSLAKQVRFATERTLLYAKQTNPAVVNYSRYHI